MSKPGDPPELADLLKAREVVETFGIDIRSLWNWQKAGVLVPATRIRRRRYYARADVERLLASGWP